MAKRCAITRVRRALPAVAALLVATTGSPGATQPDPIAAAGAASTALAPDPCAGERGSADPASEYCLIVLGSLPTDDTSTATGLNARGDVVGLSGDRRAFVWRARRMLEVTPPPGDEGLALFAINDSGSAVGSATTGGATQDGEVAYPAIVDTDAAEGGVQARRVPDLGPGVAYAINAAGAIAGAASQLGPFLIPASHGEGTRPRSLGAEGAVAHGIDDQGRVVGVNELGKAFLAEETTRMRLLENLPGDRYSAALAIGEDGSVVGVSAASGMTDGQAMIAPEGRNMRGIGRLYPEDGFSIALAVNGCGDVVGTSGRNPDLYATAGLHAFLYRDGTLHDLDRLLPADSGATLTAATAINDSGQIAGRAVIEGRLQAVLLVPRVPRVCPPAAPIDASIGR